MAPNSHETLLRRREGIRLFDLVGFERTRLVRDTLLGFALGASVLVGVLLPLVRA